MPLVVVAADKCPELSKETTPIVSWLNLEIWNFLLDFDRSFIVLFRLLDFGNGL